MNIALNTIVTYERSYIPDICLLGFLFQNGCTRNIRVKGDTSVQKNQHLARLLHLQFREVLEFIVDFVELVEQRSTFVNDWKQTEIIPSTYQLYSKIARAKEATSQSVVRFQNTIDLINIREKVADDVDKPRLSNQDCIQVHFHYFGAKIGCIKYCFIIIELNLNPCTTQRVNSVRRRLKSCMGYLSKMIQTTVKIFKVLATLLGITNINLDPNDLKESFLEKGYVEEKVRILPECTQSISINNMQTQRK